MEEGEGASSDEYDSFDEGEDLEEQVPIEHGDSDSRAFGALNFSEEIHIVQAKAHIALAAKSRWRHLEKQKAVEAADAGEKYKLLVEDLHQNLINQASKGIFADADTMKVVLSIPELRKDHAVMTKLVKMRWRGLESASAKQQNDKELVLAAVTADARSLLYASNDLRADREVVLAALRQQAAGGNTNYHHCALRWASPRLLNDKEVVLAAVASSPWALSLASEDLQADREVVLAALQKQTAKNVEAYHQNVLFYASMRLRSDRELVLEAVRSEAAAMEMASSDLKRDKDFVLLAARKAPLWERRVIFREAAADIRESVGWDSFAGAANSVLAVAGEEAPILTVTLPPPKPTVQQEETSQPGGASGTFQVSLMSGASYSFSISESAESYNTEWPDSYYSSLADNATGRIDNEADAHGYHVYDESGDDVDDDDEFDNSSWFDEDMEEEWNEGEEEEEEYEGNEEEHEGDEEEAVSEAEGEPIQPATKKRRVAETVDETTQHGTASWPVGLTVGQLAKVALVELHKNVKMDSPPSTIFILLAKHESDADTVPLTPWDWDRPVVVLSNFM